MIIIVIMQMLTSQRNCWINLYWLPFFIYFWIIFIIFYGWILLIIYLSMFQNCE